MHLTYNLKHRIANLNSEELGELAAAHGNEELLKTYYETQNFELVSKALGLEENFNAYKAACRTPDGRLHPKFVELRTDYAYFLLAHICVPDEL